MKRDYKWRIVSNLAHVPPLVNDILYILRDNFNQMTEEEHGDIKLILNELVFNSVLHGNHSDEDKYVYVDLFLHDKKINVSVTDEGAGFDYCVAQEKRSGDDYLKMESGRGIDLVIALTDELDYSNEGRTVTFAKYISGV